VDSRNGLAGTNGGIPAQALHLDAEAVVPRGDLDTAVEQVLDQPVRAVMTAANAEDRQIAVLAGQLADGVDSGGDREGIAWVRYATGTLSIA
jgi:hypothetical protein